jgi:hypothetical protein
MCPVSVIKDDEIKSNKVENGTKSLMPWGVCLGSQQLLPDLGPKVITMLITDRVSGRFIIRNPSASGFD